MRRDERWRDERSPRRWDDEGRDYGRDDAGAYRYMDYRRGYAMRPDDDRYRQGLEGGDEDERAYRPFGDSGPTAYYSQPGYGRRGRDPYDPFDSGPRATPSWRYPPGDGWRAQGREDRRDDEPRSFIDKATDEVASWFGDRNAGQRRRGDEVQAGAHRGRGPRDYRRSDERIREDVNERLTDDPYLDATDVLVSVSDGEVTLSGHVAAREDKRRAERLAEDVAGVKDVQNNVRLRPTEGPLPSGAPPSAGNF